MHIPSDIGIALRVTTRSRSGRTTASVLFFVKGLTFASWVPHIPGLQARLGLSAQALGLALLCLAIGAPLGMALSPRLVARFGAPSVAVGGGTVLALGLPLMLASQSFGWLCVALAIAGLLSGAVDVALNTYAVAAEREGRQPMMSSFHAFFSSGGLAGALIAAATLTLGIAPQSHAQMMAVVAVAAIAMSGAMTQSVDGTPRRNTSVPPGAIEQRQWDRRLLVIGALLFVCLMAEGAMADWSALFLVGAGASASVAALGYAAYSLAMAASRFAGDRIVHAAGERRLLIASALLALAGHTIAMLSSAPWVSIAGFAAVGLGLANIVPLMFRAAARSSGANQRVPLAAASGLGYLGFLVGPPVIGLLAERVELRTALTLLLVPMSGLLLARWLTPTKQARTSAVSA